MAERMDDMSGIDQADVEQAPLQRGKDPLGDDPLATDGRGYQRTGQLVISCILGVIFTAMAISDFTSGHALRGLLALVVAVLNAVIAAKERAKPKRPERAA